jgi:hypothetical protein
MVCVNQEGIYIIDYHIERHGTGPLYCITLWPLGKNVPSNPGNMADIFMMAFNPAERSFACLQYYVTQAALGHKLSCFWPASLAATTNGNAINERQRLLHHPQFHGTNLILVRIVWYRLFAALTFEECWFRTKQDWKSFQSLPASIILVYCIGSNKG